MLFWNFMKMLVFSFLTWITSDPPHIQVVTVFFSVMTNLSAEYFEEIVSQMLPYRLQFKLLIFMKYMIGMISAKKENLVEYIFRPSGLWAYEFRLILF